MRKCPLLSRKIAGTMPCIVERPDIRCHIHFYNFTSELSSFSTCRWEEQCKEHLKGKEQLVCQNALIHNIYCFSERVI